MKMKVVFVLFSILANMSVMLCAKQQDKYIEINSRERIEIIENIHAVACNGDTAAYKNLWQASIIMPRPTIMHIESMIDG